MAHCNSRINSYSANGSWIKLNKSTNNHHIFIIAFRKYPGFHLLNDSREVLLTSSIGYQALNTNLMSPPF